VRALNPDEAELWARVTATIRPLSRAKIAQEIVTPEPRRSEKPTQAAWIEKSPQAAVSPRSFGTTLDSSLDRQLRAGAVEPDRILDLHGMNLDTAWRAIDRTLERAIAAGDRVVLLVTGHHRPGDRPIARGHIRAAVHDWLAVSRHSARIAAVRGAHRRHGGGGSLYIVLRRR
jgi:DNA-nicking Smr family endonuclease